jgi:hypothetical protein
MTSALNLLCETGDALEHTARCEDVPAFRIRKRGGT